MSSRPLGWRLPAGWEMKPLGEVATLQRGFDLPVQDRQEGPFKIFAANGPVGTHNEPKVQGPGVVTGRSGSIGKVHYVEEDYWPLNTSLWVKDFHGNDPRWISRLLTWMRLEKFTRGVGVPTLNRNLVHEVEIPLPPLEEQKRIAGILDQADSLFRLRTRALDKLNTLGQAIFHEMFGENLASQRTMRLGAATSKIGSGATPRGGDSAYKPEGIPLIRSMNVRDGAFSPKGLAFIDMDQAGKLKNVVVQSNDLLLNITGASVARVCIAPETMDGARVNQHVAIIRCTDVFLPEFLEAFFLLPSVKGKLLGIAEAGATRQAITKSQIQELEVPNIGIAKQRDFVVRRHAVARQLENMLAQEKSIRSLFASFQHRAFRGEL